MDARRLKAATRAEPDPVGGWRGADLDPTELVDDQFITDDPDSYLLEPDKKRGGHRGKE